MAKEDTARLRLQAPWEWARWLFMLATTILLSWGLTETLDNGKQVASLEASHAGLRAEVAAVKGVLELAGAQLSELNTRVAVIEGNRFTTDDGKELWKALAERPLRGDVPPKWFVDRVDKLEARLEGIERRLER